jgi:AcrR family transcriptional regulator
VRRPGVEAKLFAAVERLVDAGTPLSSVTIAQLVAEAGIGRATFYLYFPDRTAFLVRLVDHARDQIAAPLEMMWGDAGAARAVLDTVVATIIERFRRHAALITTATDAAAGDPAVAARLDEHMGDFIERSTLALEAARQAGATRADLHVRETATALAWMIERVCSKVMPAADDAEAESIAQALATIIWSTLHGSGEESAV